MQKALENWLAALQLVCMHLQYGLYEGDRLSSAWRTKQHIRNGSTFSC